MKIKRAVIHCEISCCNCGGVIGLDYRNAQSIAKLKKKAKNWISLDRNGNLCPDCYESIKRKDPKFTSFL